MAGKEKMTYQVDDVLGHVSGLIELQVLLESGEGVASNLLTVGHDHMKTPAHYPKVVSKWSKSALTVRESVVTGIKCCQTYT